MDIQNIWMSQRKLHRFFQIEQMVNDLHSGASLPQITLLACNGEIQIKDGHHRLTAIWLSGRTHLKKGEYILLEVDVLKPKFGIITDLLTRI